MNVIVGASGQVGAYLVDELKRGGLPVRAVVRNPEKLADKTTETKTANLFNAGQLTAAFKGGTTAFVLTPENPASNDIIGETGQIVANYQKAIQAAGIKRVVGLSCVGAHLNGNTGNILMSRILEQGLGELDVEKIFIRPTYYFSNWLGYQEPVKQYGVLPTFFPAGFALNMISPIDLAKFIAQIITNPNPAESRTVFEVEGPRKYSAHNVAVAFAKLLGQEVSVQAIPPENWEETLLLVGFTKNTAHHLMAMTQAVIDGKAVPERPNETIKLSTTLEAYLAERVNK